MTIKDQFKVIKNNWLLLLAALVVLYVLVGEGYSPISSLSSMKTANYASDSSYGYGGMSAPMYAERMIAPMPSGGFAPQVEERKIVRSSSVGTEVPTGTFHDKEAQLKAIVGTYKGLILNEQANQQSVGTSLYYVGYYTVKVDSKNHDALVAQLKGLGEIKSYTQSADDITGGYVNTKLEIETEKARLARLEQVYKEVGEAKQKVELINTIFNQERTIKYLEDSLTRMDETVSYSTVSVNLMEKQPEYAMIQIVKLSALAQDLVDSFNSVVELVVVALPWAILLLLLRLVWKAGKNFM